MGDGEPFEQSQKGKRGEKAGASSDANVGPVGPWGPGRRKLFGVGDRAGRDVPVASGIVFLTKRHEKGSTGEAAQKTPLGDRALDDPGQSWSEIERSLQQASLGKLIEPGGLQIVGGGSDLNAVIGSRRCIAKSAIGMKEENLAVGKTGQMSPGVLKHMLIDINREDTSDDMSEQGGVVACACADFEDTKTRGKIKVLEHLGHEGRLTGGAKGDGMLAGSGRAKTGSDGPIGIDDLEILQVGVVQRDEAPTSFARIPEAIEEVKAWSGAEGSDQRTGPKRPARDDQVKQVVMEVLSRRHVPTPERHLTVGGGRYTDVKVNSLVLQGLSPPPSPEIP